MTELDEIAADIRAQLKLHMYHPGDKVKCIDASGTTPSSNLIEGVVYTVADSCFLKYTNSNSIFVMREEIQLRELLNEGCWRADRFKLIPLQEVKKSK